MTHNPRTFEAKKFQIALVLCFLALYVLTFKGICTGDDVFHYDVTQNIIKRGSMSMPEGKYDLDKHKWLGVFMARGRNGKIYLTLGPGLSVAAVPLGFVGTVLEKIADVTAYRQMMEKAREKGDVVSMLFYLRKLPSAFLAGLVNPIAMALTVLIFFNFCNMMTHSPHRSLSTSILFGTGTIIWPYSSTFWTQPIVTFCLFCAFYCLLLYRKRPKPVFLFLAGTLLGYSVITRYDSAIFAPWFVLYIIFLHRRDRKEIPHVLASFIWPLMFFFLLQIGWNFYRFGSLFGTGAKHQAFLKFSLRGKPYISLPAMLVGLDRSIFVFSPPLILGLLGAKKFRDEHRLEFLLLLGVVLTHLAFYSKFFFWAAPASWGPRFLVPMTPFLLLPACAVVDQTAWRRILASAILVVGVTIQLIGALLPLQTEAIAKYFGGQPEVLEYFVRSEIIPQGRMLLAGNVELWFLDSMPKLVLGLAIMIVCGATCYYCARQTRYRL